LCGVEPTSFFLRLGIVDSESERLAKLEAAIRERLKNVCRDTAPDEFEALVKTMAVNQRRGEKRAFQRWGSSSSANGDRLEDA
jgi:hypothetical protein